MPYRFQSWNTEARSIHGAATRALVFTLLLALVGCASVSAPTSKPSGPPTRQVHWRPAFEGVSLSAYHRALPEPIALRAARIDLHAKGVRFFVTPPRAPGASETSGMKVSTFLKRYHLQLAINASTFDPVQEIEGAPIRIIGLSVSDGVAYSAPSDKYGALIVDKDNHVTLTIEPPVNASRAYNAVGGYGALLKHGENVGAQEKRHPRTAVGLSRDGRYLYLIVIDGRQPFHSVGATMWETAEWLQWLGAYDAMNLDGGGSAEMVMAGKDGEAKILNRPIHKGTPGTERVSGNHLGVFAAPLRGH